jgi:osmoprotectant transport system permease protein
MNSKIYIPLFLSVVTLFLFIWKGDDQFLKKETITIGSKRFTESYVVGEILYKTIKNTHEVNVDLKPGMGNTAILFSALKNGQIDLYPDYSATISNEILKSDKRLSIAEINEGLKGYGIKAGVPLGFSNNFVLVMNKEKADSLGIKTISQLAKYKNLNLGLTQEFIARRDGWEGLKNTYQLPFRDLKGLDHGLAYDALNHKQVDVIVSYSTDPKLSSEAFTILKDDLEYFPSYDAIVLFRENFPTRAPISWQAIQGLQNTISEITIINLNKMGEIDKFKFSEIADIFLENKSINTGHQLTLADEIFSRELMYLLVQHLYLVLMALTLASVVGVILGFIAYHSLHTKQFILGMVTIIYTIPSLALFAIFIALFNSIGTFPAVTALFLYSLLPIVRNTFTALEQINPDLRDIIALLGLSKWFALIKIEFPLALPTIMAGIKTSAILCVGTATIAALIGAGGLGDRIIQGLASNNNNLLLSGAIPAALLSLFIYYLFEIIERLIVPKDSRTN